MTVNTLPALTWNWLRMNSTRIEDVTADSRARAAADVPAGIDEETTESTRYAGQKTAMGSDVDRLIALSGICTSSYSSQAGRKSEAPLRIDLSYEKDCHDLSSFDITAADDSEMTVIMKFKSEENGSAAVQTRYHAGRNALLKIIQVQMLDDDFTFLNDIGGSCDENGRIELIQLILGGGKTYTGARADLSGDSSFFKADIGYVVGGSGRLDMNYISDQTARKTESLINASGVLRDQAFKLFRGTIDFHKGCAASVGNEKEDVLLIDDGVVNQTVPLILCDEEDVVGNHGATIGQLDEDLLFYLRSRGLNEEEVYEMMARARMDAVSALIPDEKTRDEIRSYQNRHSN